MVTLAWPVDPGTPPATVSASRARLAGIDAIRGIAALAVVLGHSFEQTIRFLPEHSVVRRISEAVLIEYLNLGRIGVVAFFLVSGYVIPFSFNHAKPVHSFLIARLFRLYPAYWVSIGGAVLLSLYLTGEAPPSARIAANATMIQALLRQEDLIGVYWTLLYELFFYGLCVFSFMLGRIESPRYLLGMLISLTSVALITAFLRRWAGVGVPIGVPMFLAIMHLGTLTRINDFSTDPLVGRCFKIGLAVILLTVGPIAGVGFLQHASDQRLIADITSLYAGLALFLISRRSTTLDKPFLLFLGLISYSLYLFHPLCLDLFVSLAHSLDPRIAPLAVLALVPMSAVLVATLAQRYVESPFNLYGKQVRRRTLRLEQQ